MKRFKCPNCDQKFSIEQKDFEKYYSKIENIQCTYCGKTFNIQHAISLSCDEPKSENKKNEKFGCGCSNVIKNSNFQTKEKRLKTVKQQFKKLIKIIFISFSFTIIYVTFFWIIGFLFTITGCNIKSISGWFFTENVDPLRCSILETWCHPIFFILLLIGFTIIGFAEFVKNEKIKPFFDIIGIIFVFVLFLGGCINGCKIQSKFEKIEKNKKQYEKASMIATHMTVYHPYITNIDLGRIRVSSWSGKIDCDYCDHLNKIKGNY